MYIALEGIKGAGKSTIFSTLKIKSSTMVGLQRFPMTAPMSFSHPLERIVKSGSTISNVDCFIEKLFLNRAYYHYKKIDHHNGLVLGDRSIATAFVTRWNKWNDPYYTIKRIQKQYFGIVPLDVVIWIKSDVPTAVERIKARVQKSTGRSEEQYSALTAAANNYEELFKDKIYQRKIGKLQFIEIDNKESIDQTATEILGIIKFYSRR